MIVSDCGIKIIFIIAIIRLVIMRNSFSRRRIFFICDNAWWSEGIKFEVKIRYKEMDFISFSTLDHDAIKCLNFNNDIVVYASNKPVTIKSIMELVNKCNSEKVLHDKVYLNFIFSGNPLMKLLFVKMLSESNSSVCFYTLKHHDVNMKKIMHVISDTSHKVREDVFPLLSSLESFVLRSSIIDKRSIDSMATLIRNDRKTIYAIRKNIATKFYYPSFFRFHVDFSSNIELFSTII